MIFLEALRTRVGELTISRHASIANHQIGGEELGSVRQEFPSVHQQSMLAGARGQGAHLEDTFIVENNIR